MATKTFVMVKGLPGCGKSTYAEKLVLEREAGTAVRINRDLLREMLHANRFSGRKTESWVTTVRDMLITTAFSRGADLVISDDTNLDPKIEDRFRSLALSHGYTFKVADMTDVPMKLCIERDLKRPRSVGEKVIKDMHRRYLQQKPKEAEYVPGLPWAVLVDIDGTAAHMNARGPFEWDRVDEDEADEVVRDLVADSINRGDHVIMLSGRDAVCRDKTHQWLVENEFVFDDLLMREAGDMRDDTIVKAEIFDREVAGKYNVRFVLDDRDKVVVMWRERGLKVLQVAPGDF